ncbi:MAG: 1-acyl-sn-glycerol-3-phosphate acyltransferase [Myxococcales bacterium]|nr:1-acyl-sn-glycerol-3-phosphate acyltransferase [Myxococcales bacterium]
MDRPAPVTGLLPRLVNTLGSVVGFFVGWSSFLVWTVLLGALILVDVAFGPRRRMSAWAMMWTWGKGHFWTSPLWQVRHYGTEALGPGPYVVVSNHQSFVDIPCILGIGLPIRIAARDGVFRVPIMGPFLALSRQVHTDRFMEEGVATVEDGLSVLVFPEGTRSSDGEVGAFRGGAFRLAKETGTPVLPAVVWNTEIVAPKGAYWPIRPMIRCKVLLLDAVDPAEFDSAAALRDEVRRRIIARRREPQPP